MRFRFVIGMAAIAAAACTTPSQPGAGGIKATISVPAGSQFELAVLQEAKISGTNLSVRFLGVTEDSRCPSDVTCVWAGNAVARFAFFTSGQSNVNVSMNTTLDPKTSKYGGRTFTLIGLKPVPKSGSKIPATDYVAVLTTSAN